MREGRVFLLPGGYSKGKKSCVRFPSFILIMKNNPRKKERGGEMQLLILLISVRHPRKGEEVK